MYIHKRNHERNVIMPKVKTRKGASKRFTITAGGKVTYKKMGLRHILTKKSTKRKRGLRHSGILSDVEAKRVKSMLPYGRQR